MSIIAMYKETDSFYLTPRWKAKRAHILRRDGYMDQIEKRYGKRREANTVHHIFPRSEFPEYQWADWNLISVSDATHNKLENRAAGTLTEAGKELLRRTARKHNIPIPPQYAA